MDKDFFKGSLKQTPYFKREERIKELHAQLDKINAELNTIQREVDRENAESFNKIMNRYNKEMNNRPTYSMHKAVY